MQNIKVTLVLLLVGFPFVIFGQSFTGMIIDSRTNTPLSYASIGVRGKSVGGIANSNGKFLINIANAAPDDTIMVTYLGYESKTLIKRDILPTEYVIELIPIALQLDEVVAQGKREIINIGYRKASSQYTGWGDYVSSRGRLRGVAIETQEIPLKLVKFKMHLDACEFDSVRFRLHILPLAANHSGNLQSELLAENIFFNAHKNQKLVSVDLTPYNLTIHQNIIVAVEWVDSWVKKETRDESYKLTISLSREDGHTYSRKTPEEPFVAVQSKFSPTMYFETFKLGNSNAP